MFNRTTISPPAVHVNIQQQPNDAADAARLYGECMGKAMLEVANATVVKLGAHNEMTAVKITKIRDFADDKLYARLLFKVNGELFDITTEADTESMARGAYEAAFGKIFGQVITAMLPSRRLP